MPRKARRLDLRQAASKILLFLGVLAALNLAFFLTLVQPGVQEYRRLSETTAPFERLNDRRERVEEHESYLSAVERATEDLASLRGEVLSTRNERLVEVQQELAALCDEFGIQLDSVGYDDLMLIDEELDRLGMNVPLEGSYANLRQFLHAVESSNKFLIVERVSLAQGKEGGTSLSLNISLATYFAAPEQVIARSKAQRRRGRAGG